ncbi:FecCD family ABC transporter permease [Paenibacillus lautus]|uniref:FecCD family ABC transporter permease n=1 Tax=Paenibacillus lautus TaxID=1401 RepID=UPI003986302F
MGSLFTTRRVKWAALAAASVLLVACLGISILFGYHTFSLTQFWEAWFHFDGSKEHLLIRTVRIPAAFIGAAVGASLAVAGALMQVLTKNPLASPSVLGVNAGAVLAVVMVVTAAGFRYSFGQMIWIAFAGAAVTAVGVILLGSSGRGGFRAVKLTLAGAAFAAFASSITSAIMLLNDRSLDELLFWTVGSVSGRKLEQLAAILPYLAAGWLIALVLGRSFNVMAMDDDIAKGLGQRVWLIRGLTLLAVVLLAGGSVALAGPIAFIGLMVPHIGRFLFGANHFWLIPFCMLGGALLLVAADIASRFILMPKAVPVGVTTALLGVPFLIYLARRRTE